MTSIEKIDYMISCLKVAKEEMVYSEKYNKKEKEFTSYSHEYFNWSRNNRAPNQTLIRENIRNVSRIGFILAGEV